MIKLAIVSKKGDSGKTVLLVTPQKNYLNSLQNSLFSPPVNKTPLIYGGAK